MVFRKNLSVVVSILLALAAVLLVYFSLKAAKPTVPVLVARNDVMIGEVISFGDLLAKRMSPASVPQGAVRDPKEVVGRTVTFGPLLAGDIVRDRHLSGEGSLVSALLSYAPEGWVAVELPQGTGVGMRGVRRGDRVDIYSEMTVPGPDGKPVTKVGLLMPGAVVLSTPWAGSDREGNNAYVVAVSAEYAPALAETVIRDRRVSLVLMRGGEDGAVVLPDFAGAGGQR